MQESDAIIKVSYTVLESSGIIVILRQYQHQIQRQGGEGARNMKSMWPPLAAIFFMTYLYRAGGAMAPPPWIRYCIQYHYIGNIVLMRLKIIASVVSYILNEIILVSHINGACAESAKIFMI